MKTILVPTDFSPTADNALAAAISIAKRTGAKIKVLNVIEGIYEGDFNPSGTVTGEDEMDKVFLLQLMGKTRSAMKRELDKFDLKGLSVEDQVVIGSVFQSLTSTIADSNIDLIVMGMHGKGDPKNRKDAGSNTIKVVRKASCPVLIIKNKVENFKIQKVLLAIDFETINSEYIEKIKELQAVFGFELHLLYINTQINFISTAAFEQLREEFIKNYKLEGTNFKMINAYSEDEGIINYASKINTDVIALTTHGRKGINLFFFGSVSENVVKEAKVPILTYRIHS
jgi:nucleotide-binding universal stress UspA family protein